MDAQTNQQVLSGNRIVVYAGGVIVGLCQSADCHDDYSPQPASGCGDIHAIEHVPTMAKHTVTVEQMIIDGNSLRTAGIAFENGDAALKGLVFDIVTMVRDTGKVVRKYTGCSYASGNVQLRKHAIVVARAEFHALDVSGTGA